MTHWHQHPCARCGWLLPCICNDPHTHDQLCFECAAKPNTVVQPVTPPANTQPPPDETYPGWCKT
jgi:hypothetical protein